LITEASNTTGKCVKIQHCPKLFDPNRIADFVGSIISTNTGKVNIWKSRLEPFLWKKYEIWAGFGLVLGQLATKPSFG
jgi:hypothetical protein